MVGREMRQEKYDVVVVGAGIVGLASARMLQRRQPALRMAILEKESQIACHQTGHNSGVIHSGIYYKPDSLKARLCIEGAKLLTEYCDDHNIRFERCGKVIVATSEQEMPALDELYHRGTGNGVPGLRHVSDKELREIEPYAAGIAALHSPHTGIVDYRAVARAIAGDLQADGVDLLTGFQVNAITSLPDGLRITSGSDSVYTSYLLNCAGLYSDVIARKMGVPTHVRIIPFRGEYYTLRPDRASLVRGLIYPVPDPDLPFLGVHFTRTIHGRVEAGPNAVLAFAREGYSHRAIRPDEMLGTLAYPGFWRMAGRFWRSGLAEFRRSLSKPEFTRSLQRLVPDVESQDLLRGGAGVRAQAVSIDGRLADDFAVQESLRAIHVLNAPSPAATASLAIGDYIAERAIHAFELR
ncbi:MAG TPA: L-2-hydroxyglutarate oxidase [Chloroflexota bacterium]